MEDGIYKADQVQLIEAVYGGDAVTVTYQTPMETLYYSPGVLVRQAGDDVLISPVRCHIKKTCAVDIKADVQGAAATIEIARATGNIYWYDGESRKPLKPE